VVQRAALRHVGQVERPVGAEHEKARPTEIRPPDYGRVFENAAHLPSVERPAELLAALRPWLATDGR
jgi:hypothetical protein